MPISAKYLAHFGKKIRYTEKERIFILSLFRKGGIKKCPVIRFICRQEIIVYQTARAYQKFLGIITGSI